MAGKMRHALQLDDRKTMQFLLDEVERSFRRSKAERKRLHELEWDGGKDVPSILGEVEVRADFVIGIVRAWLTSGYEDSQRDGLVAQSVHGSPTLRRWLKDESADYPEFAVYVQAVEHLRAVAFRIVVGAHSDSGAHL